jgi:uncharacterized protein
MQGTDGFLMEEYIARLIDLQDLDRRLDRLRADIESIPAEISIHRKDMETHRSKFTEHEDSLKRIRNDQKRLAGERADYVARIADYKSRLLTLKTNEEYTAMLNQIAHAEKMIDQTDDKILEAMYEEDEAEKSVKRAQNERDRALKRSEAREKMLSDKLAELEGELEQILSERAEAASRVESKYLKMYEKARESGHREAVSGLRNGACGSCLTKIPAQSAGEIKGGKTFSCPICGSFVVWTSDSSL